MRREPDHTQSRRLINQTPYSECPAIINDSPLVNDWSVLMIRKTSAGYRLYSRKKNPKTGKRRNLGTFTTLAAAKQHEREVQFFKRH